MDHIIQDILLSFNSRNYKHPSDEWSIVDITTSIFLDILLAYQPNVSDYEESVNLSGIYYRSTMLYSISSPYVRLRHRRSHLQLLINLRTDLDKSTLNHYLIAIGEFRVCADLSVYRGGVLSVYLCRV